MGLTQTRVLDGFDTWGVHGVTIRKFTGDSSYPTGGYALTGSNFGFGQKPLEGVQVLGGNAAAAAYRFFWDYVNKKLVIGTSLGAENYVYAESDIKGSANTDFVNAAGYTTLPTNGALLSSLAAADNTTAFTIATQPDIARNVALVVKDATGGSVDGNLASYAIVGTFRGAAQTETISFTALNLATMGNGNVAVKYGAKPFDTITSVTPSAAQPTGFQHALGIGSLLGLPQAANPNAESAIIRLTKNAAVLTITGTYGTAGTVAFGTLADGDDISVEYTVGGEVTNATSLTAVTVILMGICRGT